MRVLSNLGDLDLNPLHTEVDIPFTTQIDLELRIVQLEVDVGDVNDRYTNYSPQVKEARLANACQTSF
ncbi:hypothetical protein PGT21_000108 [Puccinia graminis f. sp. tritici]|uniref:Uncharacterized protein n=1 Tax=Puccinia graminis f. sp. tritici TaxID=56615 RepID=A0A5B0M132_PUCGR|nr:hypothetical protein PGTUg99_000157 [Puccinia graminis f. sp. tritici]KAA1091817.1 hypothetical protein PGT21_000108 [Puccinia graminis f. sp. tritici]